MIVAAPTPPGSPRVYWACQIAGWGGYALAQSFAAVVVLGIAWPRAALELIALHGAGLVLTHLLRRYMRERLWDLLPLRQLVPRVLLASLVIGVPLGLAVSPMSIAPLNEPGVEETLHIGLARGELQTELVLPPFPEWARIMIHVANWTLLIALWNILYFATLAMRRRRAAELRQSEMARTLQQTELRLLKAQLNPHFLFNSLNSVRALIAGDAGRAQDAVTRLSRTLRYTLNAGQDELASLEEELAMVDDYLSLESLRLGERLRIERDIAPAALRARIPVMLLQTLVENAVKHGIAELEAGGVLRIAARVDACALALDIENPRPAQQTAPGTAGIGLRNATERLRLLFGDHAKLELDLAQPGRALARLRLPATP